MLISSGEHCDLDFSPSVSFGALRRLTGYRGESKIIKKNDTLLFLDRKVLRLFFPLLFNYSSYFCVSTLMKSNCNMVNDLNKPQRLVLFFLYIIFCYFSKLSFTLMSFRCFLN